MWLFIRFVVICIILLILAKMQVYLAQVYSAANVTVADRFI